MGVNVSKLGRGHNRGLSTSITLELWGLIDQDGCGGLGGPTFCGGSDSLSRFVGQYTFGQTEVLLNYGSWGHSGSSGCGHVRAWLGDHGNGRDTLQLRPGGQR